MEGRERKKERGRKVKEGERKGEERLKEGGSKLEGRWKEKKGGRRTKVEGKG